MNHATFSTQCNVFLPNLSKYMQIQKILHQITFHGNRVGGVFFHFLEFLMVLFEWSSISRLHWNSGQETVDLMQCHQPPWGYKTKRSSLKCKIFNDFLFFPNSAIVMVVKVDSREVLTIFWVGVGHRRTVGRLCITTPH